MTFVFFFGSKEKVVGAKLAGGHSCGQPENTKSHGSAQIHDFRVFLWFQRKGCLSRISQCTFFWATKQTRNRMGLRKTMICVFFFGSKGEVV
jgi:hypothetical protein